MGGLAPAVSLAALVLAHPAAGQNTAVVIAGHVVDSAGAAINGVTISATGDPTPTTRTTVSDRNGHFTIVFAAREDSYLLLARKVGFAPLLTRVSNSTPQGAITVSMVLAPSAYPLSPLAVTIPRPAAAPRAEQPSIGGYARDLEGGNVFLADRSDLDAWTRLAPGVATTDSTGYSVLGAPASQNSFVIDGMSFGGDVLPPDAVCSMSLASTTSDPSRGGFAGGQSSASSCGGGDYLLSTVRAGLIDRRSTWADDAALASPSRFGTVSGFVSGPLRTGRAHIKASFVATDRSTFQPSLARPRGALLSSFGVARDTVNALAAVLPPLGIPIAGGGTPGDARRWTAAAFLSSDWTIGATSSLRMTAYASGRHDDAGDLSPLAFPSTTTASSAHNERLMVRGSTFLHPFVDEFTTVLASAGTDRRPYLTLPAAVVRVGTAYGNGDLGLAGLRFGGAGTGSTSTSASTLDARNELSWSAGRGKHLLTFGQEGTLDWNRSSQEGAGAGVYAYQSLAALAAGTAASYTRQLAGPDVRGRSLTGSAWISDVWSPDHRISLEGGLRVDESRILSRPALNADVDTRFGYRTDMVPRDVAVSPRLGFAYLLKAQPPHTYVNPATGKPDTVFFADAADEGTAPRTNVGSGITLYGDLGAYHGRMPVTRVTDLLARTGWPGTGVTMLSCIGDATPEPDWSSPGGAIFDSCRGGAVGSSLASSEAPVALLDPGFRAPTDWKANLAFTWPYLFGWDAGAAIALKHGVGYESQDDLNLRRDPAFLLGSEGRRPVYADPASIDPASGLVSIAGSRIAPEYGSVDRYISDLHSDATQIDVALRSPRFAGGRIDVAVDYSWNSQHFEQRGFDGTTDGDPFRVTTVTGAQPHHQVIVSVSAIEWWMDLGIRLELNSGTAYTPMTAADINGDGLANDRAFVFDPSGVVDPELAAGMRTLLSGAPASARRCLQRQLGTLAAPESCRGPWQARIDLAINIEPPPHAGLGDRLHASLTLVNSGAALMRLVGISPGVVAQAAPPDDRLLFVTGFDPAAERFLYQVNPNFGRAGVGVSTSGYPPFQVELGLEYQLGPPPTNVLLRRMGLRHPSNGSYSVQQLRGALAPYLRNPVDTILVLRDSLALTGPQVADLDSLAAGYRTRVDSAAAPVLTALMQRGSQLTDRDMVMLVKPLAAALTPLRAHVHDAALAILLPAQLAKFVSLQASGAP